jgi:hypothetical protein
MGGVNWIQLAPFQITALGTDHSFRSNKKFVLTNITHFHTQ